MALSQQSSRAWARGIYGQAGKRMSAVEPGVQAAPPLLGLSGVDMVMLHKRLPRAQSWLVLVPTVSFLSITSLFMLNIWGKYTHSCIQQHVLGQKYSDSLFKYIITRNLSIGCEISGLLYI